MKAFGRGICLAGSLVALAACDMPEFGRGLGTKAAGDQKMANFQARLDRNPSDVASLVGIGDVHASQANWSRASGAYREALIVNAASREAQIGYSVSQSALGDYGAAAAHANKAVETRADTEALIASAVALNGQRQHAAAKQVLEQALAVNPRDLDVRNNLALTLALMGDRRAYQMQHAVAFAPDADFRHQRNFYLVAAMLGMEASARRDAAVLNLTNEEIDQIVAIGRKARSQGMAAFGITAKT
ncbi:MAG: hypothetical protein AAGA87_02605 [Pseudomonadota bacterium]